MHRKGKYRNTFEFLALSFLLHLFLSFILLLTGDYRIPDVKENTYTIGSVIIEKENVPVKSAHELEPLPEIKQILMKQESDKTNIVREDKKLFKKVLSVKVNRLESKKGNSLPIKRNLTGMQNTGMPPEGLGGLGGLMDNTQEGKAEQGGVSAENNAGANPPSVNTTNTGNAIYANNHHKTETPAIHTEKGLTKEGNPEVKSEQPKTINNSGFADSGVDNPGLSGSSPGNKGNPTGEGGGLKAGNGDGSTHGGTGNKNGNENGHGNGRGVGNGSGSGNGSDNKDDSGASGSFSEARGSINPLYPEEARERGESGTVVAEVEITPSGRAGNILITSSSGYPSLDNVVVSTIRNASFEPARQNGKPVLSRKRFVINFNLDEYEE